MKKAKVEQEQLWLPNLAPDPTSHFRDPAGDILPCGHAYLNEKTRTLNPLDSEYLCSYPSRLMAVYFHYGSPITASDLKDSIRDAHLIGLDSIFPDSDQIFVCGRHLGTLLELAKNEYDLPSPEVIVNALGEIEEKIYRRLLLRMQGILVSLDYFSAKHHSQGKESLQDLWQREKQHFQF